jgi:hypothetical protein
MRALSVDKAAALQKQAGQGSFAAGFALFSMAATVYQARGQSRNGTFLPFGRFSREHAMK